MGSALLYARAVSIMNRRNALVGWATWAVIKRVLKRNARANAAAAEEDEKLSRRQRRKQEAAEAPVEGKKKRPKRRVIGFLVATGIGVGVWMKTRGGRKADVE